MLLVTLPHEPDTSRSRINRRPGRIVWQQRYEGIANVAYQGGKAVAGISGPWSNRYVLTWWEPMLGGQLELFDTLEAAMDEVEKRTQCESTTRSTHGRDVASAPKYSLFARLLSSLTHRHREHTNNSTPGSIEQMRQSYFRQDTDLSGLHLRASR